MNKSLNIAERQKNSMVTMEMLDESKSFNLDQSEANANMESIH